MLLGEPLAAVRVPPGHDLAQERLVLLAAGEVAAPPTHQGLVDGLLEPIMALLGVPVLVCLPRLDRLRLQAVMVQQGLVPPGEQLGSGVGLDRGPEAVGAVLPGNSSPFPQGVLQPRAQALPALREADGAGLPVRGGEHEVVDQVVERLAGDGDAQLGHVREVRGPEPARFVVLCEEHLLGRSLGGPPVCEPPLEGPQLPVGVASREAASQVDEAGLGLEPRVEPEHLLELRPPVLERVLPGPPGVGDAPLGGEPNRVAVLACRLLVDARLVSGLGQRGFGLEQLPQPPELAIRDHPFAPSSREPKRDSLSGLRGREF